MPSNYSEETLTSVRFNQNQLEKLRLLAEAEESSIAGLVRQAVDEFTTKRLSDPSLREKIVRIRQERDALVDRLLNEANPNYPSSS